MRGIQFYQHKVEFRKKDKYFIRAYATHEDAGKSFDPYFTAQKMLNASKDNENWQNNYVEWWAKNDLGSVFKKMQALGYPAESDEGRIKWQQDNIGLLNGWHKEAEAYANKGQSGSRSLDYLISKKRRVQSHN